MDWGLKTSVKFCSRRSNSLHIALAPAEQREPSKLARKGLKVSALLFVSRAGRSILIETAFFYLGRSFDWTCTDDVKWARALHDHLHQRFYTSNDLITYHFPSSNCRFHKL